MHGFETGGATPDDPETSVLFFTVLDGEKLYTPGRCKAGELDGAADMLRRAGKGELSGIVDKDTLESLLAEIMVFERERGVADARPLFGWWRELEESFLAFTRLDGKDSHAPIRCKPSQLGRQVAAWQRDGRGEVVNVIRRSMLVAMLAELIIFEREHGIDASPSSVRPA
ncbi:hypothetical protein [Crenobacter caeni]|uniref:Uncharacterized protein n=1 Tax=Crenobacter caeni TaxID=2705474 RepID=A0A6B2KV97_9NEIS|nr:hypothetical protein [Crenobacter caeni]NDV14081.1 hypothetical protein [Crenobacter caeni]